MNRKQWFTFGIGLVVMSLILHYLDEPLNGSCSALSSQAEEIQQRLLEQSKTSDNMELINGIVEMGGQTDAWIINCFNRSLAVTIISGFGLGIGILLIICGFLEKKN